MKVQATTEMEMREEKVPWPEDLGELNEYIQSLLDIEHDYGTCVYAMSMAAEAAFNFVAKRLGVTGSQASCADLDFVRRTRNIKGPYKLVDFENALYPQYHDKFQATISSDIMRWLTEEANEKLNDHSDYPAAIDVVAHWKKLANGEPPFGLQVTDGD